MINKKKELAILSALTFIGCLFLHQGATAQGFVECYNYVDCKEYFFVKPAQEEGSAVKVGCKYDTMAVYTSKTYTCKPNGVTPVSATPVAAAV
jgi:hypothetical protein